MGVERSRHDADVDVAVRGSGRRAFAGQSWRDGDGAMGRLMRAESSLR